MARKSWSAYTGGRRGIGMAKTNDDLPELTERERADAKAAVEEIRRNRKRFKLRGITIRELLI
jgi:hypothetical protein